ncbi:MAG: putative metal-binding motif-containing protein [Alphaproteobacteria bacterium]|nr:putative metal-binding motif-containing protein [Alphaproteobacteria bacterium]
MRRCILGLVLLAACGEKEPVDTGNPETGDSEAGPVDADGDGVPAEADCDDGDASVYPEAEELCDGKDNNCDGEIDGADAVDARQGYLDADGDGFGDPEAFLRACDLPSDYVDGDDDCDDADPATFPGADELCDGEDQDCDAAVDEAALDAATWYTDADADGWGDPAAPVQACTAPSGTSALDGDCDDGDAAVHPEAIDDCNRIDDDCDLDVDEGVGSTFCEDFEADGGVNAVGDAPDGWVMELPWYGEPPQIWEVTDATSASGSQCLSTFDQDQGGNTYVIRAFKNLGEAVQPGTIQVSLRWDSADETGAGTMVFADSEVSDPSAEAYDAYTGTSLFYARVRDTQALEVTGMTAERAVTAGDWVRVEWRNIDWGAGTVDVYLDGAFVESGTFNVGSGAVRAFYYIDDDQEMYWDRIQMREE